MKYEINHLQLGEKKMDLTEAQKWVLLFVEGCNHFYHYPDDAELDEAYSLIVKIERHYDLLMLVRSGFLRFGPVKDGELTFSATEHGRRASEEAT